MESFNSKTDRKYSQTDNQCPLSHHHFYLTHRGLGQAVRNDSHNIWQAFGGGCTEFFYKTLTHRSTTATLEFPEYQKNKTKQNYRQGVRINELLQQNTQKGKKNSELQSSLQKSKKKNVTFNIQQTGGSAVNSQNKKSSSLQRNNRTQSLNQKGKINANNLIENKLTPQQKQKRQKFLKECYSIDKYLKSSKAYTRLMPNSAIKLFYQKPCIEAYGRKNTKGTSGFIYNDFMKTHNVLPHRMDNQPKKYQSYRSALNFCKRTKVDPEERWKKIHRQMKKKLDMKQLVQYYTQGIVDVNGDNIEEVLKLNINTLNATKIQRSKSFDNLRIPSSSLNLSIPQKGTEKIDLNSTRATNDTKQFPERTESLKRSKSWGKKQYLFLYKYTDKQGNTQYCKDRHGITCYVDPTFQENKQAFLQFQKRINPIEGEDVDPSDRNIDQLLLNNFVQSKQEDIPKHYLLPNCQQPYRAQKYSWKARRKSLMGTATTSKE